MRDFQFTSTRTVPDALTAAGTDRQGRFIAGGTCLLDLMKLDVETPERLIDIHRLQLEEITETADGGVRIGAMARNSAVAYHPLIRERYPLLSDAILSGASPQLRNMATVGGNLLQRTRCTYFRDVHWACNKRVPGSGCAAQEGHHRNHAIFGTSEACFATHPSDMCVALLALEATVEIEGATGKRRVGAEDFHRLPGDTPDVETVLEPGELITAVEVPRTAAGWRARYEKVRDRASYEFALVSVGAMLDFREGRIQQVRVAFGGVGTKPWRAAEVETLLTGKAAAPELFREAAEVAVREAAPRRDNRFKVKLLKRTVVRTLEDLTGVMS
ncbi:MAG TPA: xanthine dehydrogenase family protein subunit M [Bryobacteraceae bacterium]|jgi:xanthine dehydrogenase YagS FAD-binding subunit